MLGNIKELHITIPFPPSLNSLFPGKQRRHKSKAYEAWIREAKIALNQQDCSVKFDGPVEVFYFFGKPDKRKRDLFNLEKAVSDILVSYGILDDDSLIHRGTLEWKDIEGCEVQIKPYEKK